MYIAVKRGIDFLLSLAAMVIILPLMLIISICVKLDDPSGPVFFKQKRFGKNKEFFYIYKFRSLRTDAPKDVPTEDMNPGEYTTRVGRFIRRFSLDELPQFVNVLKGDMSIVAPRPALWNQDHLIEERDKYKGRYGLTPNSLRPGLTGWAQINGRDDLNDEKKAELDGYYIQHISFLFDVKCFFMTFAKVFKHEGVRE